MKNLKDYIIRAKEKYKNNIYVKLSEKNYTYEEVIDNALEWTNYLEKNSIKKGDRIGIVVPKSPEQLKAFLCTWMLEGIALPINENSKPEELKFILEDATPTVVLTTLKLKDKVKNAYPSAKILLVEFLNELSGEEKHIKKDNEKSSKESSREEVAALIYTSGSTGNPKGVILTHKNLIANGLSMIRMKKLTSNDCFYSLLPYWHSFAMTIEIIGSINCGFSIGFAKSQKSYIENIPKFKATIILAVPRVLEIIKGGIEKKIKEAGLEAEMGYNKLLEIAPLVKGDKFNFIPDKNYISTYEMLDEKILQAIRKPFGENFREFISGGGALDINLQRYFGYIGLPIMQGYGLTEASPVVSTDMKENYSYGSIGDILDWLLPENGGDFEFLDESGNRGKKLKGELLLKGDCIMSGYWNHQDESAKAIKDGWLFTGDIGYYEDNNLYIGGRKTNMIVLKGGENIHPEFIENELKKSNIIDDIMVIGDGCKNVYACLTITEQYDLMHEDELNILLKSEVKRLTSHLISYQKPKDFLLLSRFNIEDSTYTGTMKVRRTAVNKRDNKKINKFLTKLGEK